MSKINKNIPFSIALPPPPPEPHPQPQEQPPQPQAMSDEVFILGSTSNIVLRPIDHSHSASERVRTTTDLMMHRKWVKLRHFEYDITENNSILRASDVLFRFYCDSKPRNNGCEVQEMSVWLDDYEYLSEVAAG